MCRWFYWNLKWPPQQVDFFVTAKKKHQFFQMFGVKLNGSNFRPPEVVGRGSETLTLQNWQVM